MAEKPPKPDLSSIIKVSKSIVVEVGGKIAYSSSDPRVTIVRKT